MFSRDCRLISDFKDKLVKSAGFAENLNLSLNQIEVIQNRISEKNTL